MATQLIFKGFVQINSLINNRIPTIAPIGEMSPLSKSFAREQAIYTAANAVGLELNAFTVKSGDSVLQNWNELEVDTNLGAVYSLHISNMLEICEWIVLQGQSGRLSQNADNFRSQFIAQWGETYTLNDSGLMTQGVNMWCPAWIDISWSISTASKNTNKLWFAAEAFDEQYDDFEILPVKPIADLDEFFTSYTHVKNLAAAVTMTETMVNVSLVKDGYPDTNVITTVFEWIDPVNRQLRVPIDWTVVVYGAAGENLDNIKEAIVKWVLANSTHPRAEWEVIFPDIFNATEFIVTPMWNNYSIPNRELEAGLYSPIVPVADAIKMANATAKGTGYTPDHVGKVVQIVPNTYKSVGLVIIGGPKNRDGIDQFNRQFKDYLALPSTHLDFQRMDVKTRGFLIMLSGMLRHAETLTLQSSVPREHTRTVREGIVYLSRTYQRVQYLVVTKYSLNDPTTGIPDLLLDGDGYTLVDADGEELI